MTQSLQNMNVAILMANGFDEPQFIEIQKKMQMMGASIKIVSHNQGLISGWDGQGWGHSHAVDVPLNGALGVDYDILVVISGARSFSKLSATAHTRRFVSSIVGAQKPVIVMGDAVELMSEIQQLEGLTVSCSPDSQDVCHHAGARISEDAIHVDGHVMTGAMDMESKDTYLDMMQEFLQNHAMNMESEAKAA